MKWFFRTRKRCPTCRATFHGKGTVCAKCSPALIPEAVSSPLAHPQDADATELFTTRSTDLYLNVINQVEETSEDDATAVFTARSTNLYLNAINQAQEKGEDDATEAFTAHPINLYLNAIETLNHVDSEATEHAVDNPAVVDAVEGQEVNPSIDTDATMRIVPPPVDTDATKRIVAPFIDTDATRQVVARSTEGDATRVIKPRVIDGDATRQILRTSISRLYAQAIARAAKQPDSAQTDPQPEARQKPEKVRASSRSRTKTTPAPKTGAPQKRSRRSLLAAFHLVVDLVLLLALVLISVASYQQSVHIQQLPHAQQVRQRADQAKALYHSLLDQQQNQQLLRQDRQQAQSLVKQFHQEVMAWGQTHLYHDTFNGHSYPLDSGYMGQGIGALIDKDLSEARVPADFEEVSGETQYALFNFHTMQADYADHTPYDKPHASDLTMLEHYGLQQKMVVMISLVEQVMRVYQQGKLVHAFYITTGLAELPSLPGVWKTLDRQSPVNFTSSEPPGSPYWFPPTPISYAILYHEGGFFLHDAWWRKSFGPGTQFPHQDDGGNTPYNYDGSHGCINLSEADATWLYQHTNFDSTIVIY